MCFSLVLNFCFDTLWSITQKGWLIVKKVPPYSNKSEKSLLYLLKRLKIMNHSRPDELRNERSELISKCHHVNKF